MSKVPSYRKAFKKMSTPAVVISKYVPTWSADTIDQYEDFLAEDFLAEAIKIEEELEVLYEDFLAEAIKAEYELEVLRSIAEETHTAWVEYEVPEIEAPLFDCSSSVDEELSDDEIEAMNASFLATYERELPRHMRSPEYL